MKVSLYQCFHAKVNDQRIRCAKGHTLDTGRVDGTISIIRLMRGLPLELTYCQTCPDFSSMGPPIPKEDRGWL